MYRLFKAYLICHGNDSSLDKIEASFTYFLLLKIYLYLQFLYSSLVSVHFRKCLVLYKEQNAVLVVKAVHCLSNLSYADGSGLVKIEDSLTFSAFEFLSLVIITNLYASMSTRQLNIQFDAMVILLKIPYYLVNKRMQQQMYRQFNAYPIGHVNDSSFDKIEASFTYFMLLKTSFYLQFLYSWLDSVQYTKNTYLQQKSQFRYPSKIKFYFHFFCQDSILSVSYFTNDRMQYQL